MVKHKITEPKEKEEVLLRGTVTRIVTYNAFINLFNVIKESCPFYLQ